MKKMRQFLCCMLVGTMLAASLAGCGGDPGEPKPEGNQTEQNSGTEDTEQDKPEPEDTGTTQEVGNKPEEGGNYAEHMEVIIDNTQIAAINPIGAGGPGSATGWVYKMVYDTLVTWDGEGGYLPCLATSWDTEDWKTITFHLRDDVTFSNGEPLTAYDVEYTIQKALENPGSVAGGQWSAVLYCEELDETT